MSVTPKSDKYGQGGESESGGVSQSSGGGSSGHKASFRGANKLARRAKSFKEDLLERIHTMSLRSAASGQTQFLTNRSHSPLNPKSRGQSKGDDLETNPAKDLEILVRQVQFDLKHFCDVISKNKLEMLPGNGTIMLDTITNIHTAIRPYVSPLGASPSASLNAALNRLCQTLAKLIRVCDQVMLAGEVSPTLQVTVEHVTNDVQKAVENLAAIAAEKMTGGSNGESNKTNGTSGTESKNMKLQVRPAVDGIRSSANEGQRNSLPDISLTEGNGVGMTVRNSHSTESILDSVTSSGHQDPPPKPPRPVRTCDVAPPLPPKRKPNDNNSLLGLSAIDRVSLQSHSSGSLDSMLNTSNDEEIRAIMDRSSTNLEDSVQHTASDIMGICSCPSVEGFSQTNGNRLSMESNSTIGTNSSAGISNNRFSNVIAPYQTQQSNNRLSNEINSNQTTNNNRFSNESGFESMGNARCSETSYSSFNSMSTQQKASFSFIDSTPTPGDMPPLIITDFADDKTPKIASLQTKHLTSMSNVVQQSMKQISSSTNFFENSTKMMASNGKAAQAFSHLSSLTKGSIEQQQHSIESSAFDAQKSASAFKMESSSVQSFTQTQSSTQVSKTTVSSLGTSNLSSSVSNNSSSVASFASLRSNIADLSIGDVNNVGNDTVDASSLIPPALPVKTRKQQMKMGSQYDNLNEIGLNSLLPSVDDQTIEYREHSTTCALHGTSIEGFMQRPHTLMDQSSGQPPPLPMKKKHMFQSVAYSVMAYMEMFGNCSHSPQSSTEFLRHSVHAYNAGQHHHAFVSSSQLHQLAGGTMTGTSAMEGQVMVAQNGQLLTGSGGMLGYASQHLTQSHTLHQFTLPSTAVGNNISQQNLSGFSSPLRSPHLAREDSIKSDASSISSVPTSGPIIQLPPSPVPGPPVPPALPPKRTKIRQTPNHSPAKPPLSPKTLSITPIAMSTPSTPGPITAPGSAATPAAGPTSISPAPRFQFDPPPITEDSLLSNMEDVSWQSSPNKLGKFPVEDLDSELTTNASSSPGSRDAEPPLENETDSEPDVMLEMDVSTRLVYKRSGEDGPDIRGGHPDALVVHAIKSTKDFSYQEAFLTTYRTFVPPIQLIEKLSRRHALLARLGKHTKAREVQALLTRIVGDLTMADIESDLLQLTSEFIYGLVASGDLAMAKVLRVIIIDKFKNKQLMQQQAYLDSTFQNNVLSARRDSVLEQKAEAVAEQMTLLDAELFTRIPAPEALLWARDQCEERSPNLTRFTEHFNKMSYWARSRILEQQEAREREKYVTKFIKVMKHLRKMNNFNSYLALLSALDSAPIRRLEWQKQITDSLKEYCALIDSSSSFRAYRLALGETQPPCIPYIGLVLQDLTFVHIGNTDLLPDGSINFSKRWQQYHILENMKRFSKAQYTFKKNDRIISMFNGFDDVLNEEAMWQISESLKPRGGKKTTST